MRIYVHTCRHWLTVGHHPRKQPCKHLITDKDAVSTQMIYMSTYIYLYVCIYVYIYI